MAKAQAQCKCEICGSTFFRTATRHNRHEAESWKEWAEKNCTVCPKCYAKQKEEEEQAKPLTLTVSFSPFATPPLVTLSWSGKTRGREEELKTLGYEFRSPISSGGLNDWLGLKPSRKAWTKDITVEESEAEIEQAQDLAEKVVNHIQPEDIMAYRIRMEREKSLQREIASIPKPEKPKCYPTGRWNGKVYGYGHAGYSIYVDGQKIAVTQQEKDELTRYLVDMAAYREEVKKIKEDFHES